MADDAVTPTREIVTRAEALAAGLKYYFTGKPCPRGHVDTRHVGGGCVPCERERVRLQNGKSYRENAEYRKKAIADSRDRYAKIQADPNRVKVKNDSEKKRYRKRLSDPEYALEAREKWRIGKRNYTEKYPEATKALTQKRRSRMLGADGHHKPSDIARIIKQQKHKCAYCRACLKGGYHIDHIMPLALGGSNWPSNLQGLCAPCNLSKGAKHPIDFAQEKGRLL